MKTTKDNGQHVLTKEQQKMVEEHLELAMNMGIRYRDNILSVEDLQQEACLGLCEAALRYDGTQKMTFQTFAYFWCRKFIQRALAYESGKPSVTLSGIVYVTEDTEEENALLTKRALKVQELLKVLSRQERQIVCCVYGINQKDSTEPPTEPMDFQQIAEAMTLPKIRVQQLYERALNKMETINR